MEGNIVIFGTKKPKSGRLLSVKREAVLSLVYCFGKLFKFEKKLGMNSQEIMRFFRAYVKTCGSGKISNCRNADLPERL